MTASDGYKARDRVLFGVGLETGIGDAATLVGHARLADRDGLPTGTAVAKWSNEIVPAVKRQIGLMGSDQLPWGI